MDEPRFLMVPGLGLTAEAWEPTIDGLVRRGVPGWPRLAARWLATAARETPRLAEQVRQTRGGVPRV